MSHSSSTSSFAMENSNGIFRNICKGDGRGAYIVARGNSYCPYEPAHSSQTPRTPHSPWSEKDGLYDGTVYDGERRCPARRLPALAFHGLVLLAYSTLLTVLVIAAMRKPDCEQCILYESPAKNLVDYTIQTVDQHTLDADIYAGDPRPELEAAWDSLLGQSNVRLTEQEVLAVDGLENAVALPDGGYAGTLNVFHELHCIRWLHTQLYSDVYFPSANTTTTASSRVHTEACLSQLRRATLCHADVGVVTYNWDLETLAPRTHAAYQCANLGPLLQWTEERSVDLVKSGYLVHPVFGNVFPDEITDEEDTELELVLKEGLGAIRRSSGSIMR